MRYPLHGQIDILEERPLMFILRTDDPNLSDTLHVSDDWSDI